MKSATYTNHPRMRPVKKREHNDSTASKIFKKEYQYPFMVDRLHFKVRGGNMEMPFYFDRDGRGRHNVNVGNELIPTVGTIIEMSDYYQDGAHLSINDNKISLEIYRIILSHLEAHLDQMYNNLHYKLPEDDALRELAEFALAIRPSALDGEKNVDENLARPLHGISSFANRAFIGMGTIKKDKKKEEIPRPLMILDSLDEFFSRYGR